MQPGREGAGGWHWAPGAAAKSVRRTSLAAFHHRTTPEMDGGVRRISSGITVDQRAEQNYYALALVMNFNSILVKTIYSGDCLQDGALALAG
jgi:hypothetical protein